MKYRRVDVRFIENTQESLNLMNQMIQEVIDGKCKVNTPYLLECWWYDLQDLENGHAQMRNAVAFIDGEPVLTLLKPTLLYTDESGMDCIEDTASEVIRLLDAPDFHACYQRDDTYSRLIAF